MKYNYLTCYTNISLPIFLIDCLLQLSTDLPIDYMKMTMDAADSARLGLNLNLSVQPQSYHWIQSPKGTDDEDEDDRRRVDDDGTPEEEPDILEMQVCLIGNILFKPSYYNKL